ncbi:16S rRNA (guanine(966)-N(2))-methyltransferase RsmD [Microbacterium sp. zg.Y625]|uniref:16S rRNA (guanine(966)-N(2))-methyltransferase RsmD n=1 Tax=Microbacterium jiangjiandongii TaxID=3049071 RepID=UPI00214C7101|nr:MULTISPECIES: 16S rRNA (guanine(966)-N(2))-methyltransferase RsmD [unclassified Microbacterium]MCR2792980.1 16S rRNA (guanine(966)-N(2))-methyltransferase RsmD [Microbacterium sp. zg.Y625]WIM24096.1 16S rRNA (guanine(966)-N(2))-methyltransferase RsmD [Microbacterium sp. zg-Y625]
MTRIISGAAGSLTLVVPDAGTRPTSDRVREALFSSLEAADVLAGARVVDLYAGSGALGLEALSRGASAVDLVEKAPKAASTAQRNAAAVARAVRAPSVAWRVHRSSADAFLRAGNDQFDLVFLDPPYDIGEAELTQTLSLLVPRLAPDATVVIERARRSPQPGLPEGLVLDRDKRYGDTTLWWVTTA